MFSFSSENAAAIRQAYEEGSRTAARQMEAFRGSPQFTGPKSSLEDFPIVFATASLECVSAYFTYAFMSKSEDVLGRKAYLVISGTLIFFSTAEIFSHFLTFWRMSKKKVTLDYPEQYKGAIGSLYSSAKILKICQNKVFQARPCSAFSSLLGRCRSLASPFSENT